MRSSVINNGGRVAADTSKEAAARAGGTADGAKGGFIMLGSAPKTDWPEAIEILLANIKVSDSTHPRDHIDRGAVEEYAQAMRDGATFPPVEVVGSVEGPAWLSDGRHRYEAVKLNGWDKIRAVVIAGDERSAVLHAVEANGAHGVRRSTKDKRKSVMLLVQDPEWGQWSDNEIAKRCNVSWDLVKSVRTEYKRAHPQAAEDGMTNGKKCKRNGKEYEQQSAVSKPQPAHIAAIGEMRELAGKARASVPEGDSKLAEALDRVGSELHEILGKATGATERMTEGLKVPLNVYEHQLKGGIQATPEFAVKGLATHAVNVGLGCGHQCLYCSSPSLRCRLPAYGELQLSAYARGFAVIDPKTPERILKDIPKLTATDTVMLCTCDDAWSPEARRHGVGRKCLEALLKDTPAQIRVLTKSAEVAKDLVVAKGFEKRVMVGISLGIPEGREDVAAAVEPNASTIRERLKALKQAHDLGFKTYGMLCPCLPLVADTEAALTEMFRAVNVIGAEDIWLEPVNARGKALGNTAAALRIAGLGKEADAVDAIGTKEEWSKYAAGLAETAAKVAEKQGLLGKLHVLLYEDRFTDADIERVKALGGAVIMLGKGKDCGRPEPAKADTGDGGGKASEGRTSAA